MRFEAPLAAILAAFSAAALLADAGFLGAPAAGSPLCRLYLCSNALLLDRARGAAAEPGKAAAEAAAADFREALRRDVSYPYRWCDLGEAASRAGSATEARYCYQRALYLAPNSPYILLRAANFEFAQDRPSAALPLTTRILELVPDFDAPIFLAYSRAGLSPAAVIRDALPPGPRPATAYFEHLLATGAEAAEVWQWIRARNYTTTPLAARYTASLFARGRYEEARRIWTEHTGSANPVFNGGFESDLTGAPLDWSLHAQEQRDASTSRNGKYSLRAAFDGRSNIDYSGAFQSVVVPPGAYRFSAYIKTRNLTTNQGVAFRVLDRTTAAVTGTADWTQVTQEIAVAAGGQPVKIQLIRRPSDKLDNRISGEAWIDDVELVSVRPQPR